VAPVAYQHIKALVHERTALPLLRRCQPGPSWTHFLGDFKLRVLWWMPWGTLGYAFNRSIWERIHAQREVRLKRMFWCLVPLGTQALIHLLPKHYSPAGLAQKPCAGHIRSVYHVLFFGIRGPSVHSTTAAGPRLFSHGVSASWPSADTLRWSRASAVHIRACGAHFNFTDKDCNNPIPEELWRA